MAKKKKKPAASQAALDMTPMIDVVFQLIIFFVVTLKEEDILSHLDAMSPAPDANAKPENNIELVSIDIYNPRVQGGHGFLFNKTPVSEAQLDAKLKSVARLSKTSSILLRCTKDSPHALLIKAMNLCNKHELTKLAIFSL